MESTYLKGSGRFGGFASVRLNGVFFNSNVFDMCVKS